MRQRLLLAGALLVLLTAAAAFGAWGYAKQQLLPLASASPDVLFSVERGATLSSIARRLEAQGIVRSARAVRWLGRYLELDGRIHVGEYWLSATLAPAEILERLASGDVATFEVVVPEGFTAAQIAERLGSAGVVDTTAFTTVAFDPATPKALGVEGDSLEGYLFPETYRLPHRMEPLEVARAFVAQFLVVWREIEPQARAQGFSMHDVVTLASIVEKETGAPRERPLIAAVFRNRMQKGMRLETDPTVIYGIPDFDGNLRRVHLEDRSNPYNTYVIPGLPPGPIASPGAEALRAVVNPADSNYLFFVSKNDGTHTFSRTFEEHVAAVNRYQRRR